MKTILLSFKPEYFAPLKAGAKKYEYRSRFADEDLLAYIYLSSPVKAVTAVVRLGRRLLLEDLKRRYGEYPETLARIEEYQTIYRKKYAIPILSVEPIEPIRLETIRKSIPGFMPPQSYAIVREPSILKDCLDRAKPIGKPRQLDHDHIRPEDVCCN